MLHPLAIRPILPAFVQLLATGMVWLAENLSCPVPSTARLSPYVGCAARKPG